MLVAAPGEAGDKKGNALTISAVEESSVDETFLNKLKARTENTNHLEFQLGDISFNAGAAPSIILDGKSYKLTDGSFRQLSEQMNIPTAYARRIPDDLLAYTMNYFIKGSKRNHLAALVEGEHLRSFMKVNTPYVTNLEMLDALKEAGGENFSLKYAKISDTVTSFSFLPDQYRESIDGSNLYGGLKVVFSDAWDVHPTIDSYIWRELCSNGMISELESRKFRVANAPHDDVIRQIRDFATSAIEKLPELFESFERLSSESVVDYVKMIQRIVLEYKLPNKVRDRLLFWATSPDFLFTITDQKITNMSDIVNLITWTGSHDLELTPEIKRRLLEIGGSLTLSHTDRCNTCGSTV